MPNKRRAKHRPSRPRLGRRAGRGRHRRTIAAAYTGAVPRRQSDQMRQKIRFQAFVAPHALRHGKGTSDQGGFVGPSYRMSVTLLRLSKPRRPIKAPAHGPGESRIHTVPWPQSPSGMRRPGAHNFGQRDRQRRPGGPILADRDTGLVVREPLRTQVRLLAGRVGTSPSPHPSPHRHDRDATAGRHIEVTTRRGGTNIVAQAGQNSAAGVAALGERLENRRACGGRRRGGKRAATTYFLGDLTTAQVRRIEWLRRPG